jgi:hypothetical protein
MSRARSQVEIVVTQGDALQKSADVLVLKYARESFGLDFQLIRRFQDAKIDSFDLAPDQGVAKLVDGKGLTAADRILILGVGLVYDFRYREIREFARNALRILRREAPDARKLLLTLHGAGYGLDEMEAFESELAGLADAIGADECPSQLAQIEIVEIEPGRARRLKAALSLLFPSGYICADHAKVFDEAEAQSADRLRAAGYASESKPHVFVAMPFTKDMDDVYYYGIEHPIRDAGFVCERADLMAFTGDVMSWVKKRIQGSKLVIADLTTANPNVYLEVGYAWGLGIPTILLVRDSADLKFNVRGQRCLKYDRIKDLETALQFELRNLKG